MAVDAVSHQKTIQEIIDSTANKTSERNTGELGKDEFLNLLITQLQYQDPLNPVDDKEFISQMAQFSALEQMQNLNSSFSATKAFGMIGKYITANKTDSSTSKTELVEGTVRSVKMEGGKTILVVDGMDIPVENVLKVSEGYGQYNNSNISQYTGIIGYKVKGSVYDSSTGDIIGVSGIVKEIQKGAYENYAVMDGVEVTIAAIDTLYNSADPNFRKDYLTENIGNSVSLIITDAYGYGLQVPVSGVLRDFNIAPDGKVTGVLDGVYVPVESIHNIKGQSTKADIVDSTEKDSQVEESENEEPDSV